MCVRACVCSGIFVWFDARHEEVGTLATLKLFLETTYTHTIVGLKTFKQNKVEKSSFIGSSLSLSFFF